MTTVKLTSYLFFGVLLTVTFLSVAPLAAPLMNTPTITPNAKQGLTDLRLIIGLSSPRAASLSRLQPPTNLVRTASDSPEPKMDGVKVQDTNAPIQNKSVESEKSLLGVSNLDESPVSAGDTINVVGGEVLSRNASRDFYPPTGFVSIPEMPSPPLE